MTLHILVLDDNLGAMHEEISDGLKTYLGQNVSVPDFKVGEQRTLSVPAMPGHNSVKLAFGANRPDMRSGRKVAEEIRKGAFDTILWDAVIVDNNWNPRKLENADGCDEILPALLESLHFKSQKPEYLLFTWHFNDDAHHSIIRGELASFSKAGVKIRPIAKGDKYQLAQWFGDMIAARVDKRLRPTEEREPLRAGDDEERQRKKKGHQNPRTKYSVEVAKNGSFTVNGEAPKKETEPHIQGKHLTCLLFLFFLSREEVPLERTKDVMACNLWLKDRSLKAAAECPNHGLGPAIIERLESITAFSNQLVFNDQVKADVARKAWNGFRNRYKCGDIEGSGAAGNAPHTILRSISVDKFELPLVKFKN